MTEPLRISVEIAAEIRATCRDRAKRYFRCSHEDIKTIDGGGDLVTLFRNGAPLARIDAALKDAGVV